VESDNEGQWILHRLERKETGKTVAEQNQEMAEKSIKAIEEAKDLMGLITTPTWKVIERHIDEIKRRKGVKRERLRPDELKGLAELETDHVFRSGIEFGLELFRQGIERKIKQIPILMQTLEQRGITLKEKSSNDG
jgi:hypothetical protein